MGFLMLYSCFILAVLRKEPQWDKQLLCCGVILLKSVRIHGDLKKTNIKMSYTYFSQQMSAVRDKKKKENLKERNEKLVEGDKCD